jgi:hypothetical protein
VVTVIVLVVCAGSVMAVVFGTLGFRKLQERVHDHRAKRWVNLEPAGEVELRRANSL